MQLDNQDNIFINSDKVFIEGYCTCDLYFPLTKEVNFKKNKAHYVQIFYLTTSYGLYQLFIAEEYSICDLEMVNKFEEPYIIIDEKLSESFKNIVFCYYTKNKHNNDKNKQFVEKIFNNDIYIYDFKDCILKIDESNFIDINIFFKKKQLFRQVNYVDFENLVLNVKLPSAPVGSLDEKLNLLKQINEVNNIKNKKSSTSDNSVIIR
jgi:hypothetical protein